MLGPLVKCTPAKFLKIFLLSGEESAGTSGSGHYATLPTSGSDHYHIQARGETLSNMSYCWWPLFFSVATLRKVSLEFVYLVQIEKEKSVPYIVKELEDIWRR